MADTPRQDANFRFSAFNPLIYIKADNLGVGNRAPGPSAEDPVERRQSVTDTALLFARFERLGLQGLSIETGLEGLIDAVRRKVAPDEKPDEFTARVEDWSARLLADAAAAGGSLDHCWGLVEGKAKCAVLLAVLSGNAQDAEEFLTESVQTLSGRPAVPTRDARPTPARPPSEHDGLWNADAHVPPASRTEPDGF